jgi:hypothetical protein
MSKVKKIVKSAAKVISSVVPDELKPAVKIGLAFIPGVGPALSAGYSAVDAYGSGKSLGSSLLTGAKSFAVSQVAGAASKALGISTQGNDLTDALGQTSGEGVLGLNGELSGAAKTLGLSGTSAASTAAPAAVSEASAASTAAAAAAKTTTEAPGFFTRNAGTIDTIGKVAAVGAAASSLLASPAAPASSMDASTTTTDTMRAEAAAAAEEENRRKRGNRGSNSNIFTSPLGLVDQGKSAASVLLG